MSFRSDLAELLWRLIRPSAQVAYQAGYDARREPCTETFEVTLLRDYAGEKIYISVDCLCGARPHVQISRKSADSQESGA